MRTCDQACDKRNTKKLDPRETPPILEYFKYSQIND